MGSIAIKIPRFSFKNHTNFLYGCLSNWKERQFYRDFKDISGFGDLVVPSLWCSWFGLIQIQRRSKQLGRELTIDEIELMKPICSDIKECNFGIYKGRLVCLDYGD